MPEVHASYDAVLPRHGSLVIQSYRSLREGSGCLWGLLSGTMLFRFYDGGHLVKDIVETFLSSSITCTKS